MKQMTSILRFHLTTFLRDGKYVVPLTLLVLLQFTLVFAIMRHPADFLESVFLMEIFTFIVAVSLGFGASKWTDPVTEQLLILRTKKGITYYSVHVIFLLIVSAGLSLVSLLIPTLLHLLNPGMFERFTLNYFVLSYLLFLGSSFAGMSLGALFHPRLVTTSSNVPLYVSAIGLMAITRNPVESQYAILRFVLWIFPNLSAHQSLMSNQDFTLLNVVPLAIISLVYGIIYSVIKVVGLSRRKF